MKISIRVYASFSLVLFGSAILPGAFALPSLNTNCNNLYVGYQLEAPCVMTLSQPAPAGGLVVQLEVDGQVTGGVNYTPFALSSTALQIGAGGLTLNFPAGSSAQTFWVQNPSAVFGHRDFYAFAPGYSGVQPYINFTTSSFSFGQSKLTASVAHGPVSYPIYATPLINGLAGPPQTLLPGLTQSIYVANLRSNVGNPKNPVIFQGGAASATVLFTPVAAGTDLLCIEQPNPFEESKNLNEPTITVTNP